MSNLLCTILELAILFPGAVLAYIPMHSYLRFSIRKHTLLLCTALTFICVACGLVSYMLQLNTMYIMPVATVLSGIIYMYSLRISRWKSINVFLAICAAFTCIGSVARALDSLFYPGNTMPWFGPTTILVYHLMCWIFILLAWYPATHAAKELLEEENIVQTWYVFWILPLVFIGLNIFMIPVKPNILSQGRILEGYIVISLVLLSILSLFYALFYLMARSLSRIERLWLENQFLSMEQAQYDTLLISVEETRHARHDMRHHINAIAALTKQQSWQELEKYLAAVQESIPNTDLMFCKNSVINGVASHYGVLFQTHEIPYTFELDLPPSTPIPEIDLCVILSNLLENALEASLHTKVSKRNVHVRAHMHSEHVILLTVENTFDIEPKEKNGIFQSSKRRGEGTGIRSVVRIVDKTGGYSRFSYENGVFFADIMLRSEI